MTDYREILRLLSLEHSQRSIAREAKCSCDKVAEVLKASAAAGISWPLDDSVTNCEFRSGSTICTHF